MRTVTVIGARALAVIAVALTTGVLVAAESSASTPGDAAPDGPGAQSYLDLARKDCFGTARNTTSKVWFTVADGVLSDTFSPTIENSNVNTLQYIVTDGRAFTDTRQRGHAHDARAAARHDDRELPPPQGLCPLRRADRQHRRGRKDQCATEQC